MGPWYLAGIAFTSPAAITATWLGTYVDYRWKDGERTDVTFGEAVVLATAVTGLSILGAGIGARVGAAYGAGRGAAAGGHVGAAVGAIAGGAAGAVSGGYLGGELAEFGLGFGPVWGTVEQASTH